MTLACLLGACTISWAQKKEISQAKSYVKSGTNLDKAEQLMEGLLKKDTANRSNPKIYLTWMQAVEKQYEIANEKLYLKQKYDTAAFFNLTRKLYGIAETLDSIDAQPDEKGRVKLRYREDNAEKLDRLRQNLYYGGTFHLRKEQLTLAYGFFQCYLNSAQQPLFESYQYQKTDTLLSEVAYWACYTGHKMHDAEHTLRYFDCAVKDTAKARYAIQYACEAYHWQGDEANYLNMLKRGFGQYPEFNYFFPRLIDYYNSKERPDSALFYADEALRTNPDNELFLLARSVALLNLERYDECIRVSERLIAKNDTLAEPYFNIATAKLNQVLAIERLNQPRVYREQIHRLYMEARPYMEAYRKLEPGARHKWAPALYRIYLNLNMGKQFEEIDKIMRKL